MKRPKIEDYWTELSDVTINHEICNGLFYGMYIKTTDVNVLKYLMKKAHLKNVPLCKETK